MSVDFSDMGEEEPREAIASFDSRCGICDEKIYEGDRIKYIDDEWVHYECDG
jgi:hypothetical protein